MDSNTQGADEVAQRIINDGDEPVDDTQTQDDNNGDNGGDDYTHTGAADTSGTERPDGPSSESGQTEESGPVETGNNYKQDLRESRDALTTTVNSFTTDVNPQEDGGHSFLDEIQARAETHREGVGEEGNEMSSIVDAESVESFTDEAIEQTGVIREGRDDLIQESENVAEAARSYSEQIADIADNKMEEGVSSEVVESVESDVGELFEANVAQHFYGETNTGVNQETVGVTEGSLIANREDANSNVNRLKQSLEDETLQIGSALENAFETLETFSEIYSDADEAVENSENEIEQVRELAKSYADAWANGEQAQSEMRSNAEMNQGSQRNKVRRFMTSVLPMTGSEEGGDIPDLEDVDPDQLDEEGYKQKVDEAAENAEEALKTVRDAAATAVIEQFHTLSDTYEQVQELRDELSAVVENQEELERSLELTNEEVYGSISGLGEARASALEEVATEIEGDEFRTQTEAPDNLATIARMDSEDLRQVVESTGNEEAFQSADYSEIVSEAEGYVSEIAGEFGLDSKPDEIGVIGRTLGQNEDQLKVHLMESAYRQSSDIKGSVNGYLENNLNLETNSEAVEILENLGAEYDEENLDEGNDYDSAISALSDYVSGLGDRVDLEELSSDEDEEVYEE